MTANVRGNPTVAGRRKMATAPAEFDRGRRRDLAGASGQRFLVGGAGVGAGATGSGLGLGRASLMVSDSF
jgi:hypothetical protein